VIDRRSTLRTHSHWRWVLPGAWWFGRDYFVVRLSLVPVFVLLCYQWGWEFLRFLTSEAVRLLDGWMGLSLVRISFDTIHWHGDSFQFQVSCTFADAFCGAIPLLWDSKSSNSRNLLKLGVIFACLFPLNVVRLSSGFLLHARGIPWWLAHETISGFTYFIFLVWLLRHRGYVS
jgi:hypothetical protein